MWPHSKPRLVYCSHDSIQTQSTWITKITTSGMSLLARKPDITGSTKNMIKWQDSPNSTITRIVAVITHEEVAAFGNFEKLLFKRCPGALRTQDEVSCTNAVSGMGIAKF